jgi:hypothetical protein
MGEDSRPHKYAAKTAEGRKRQLRNMQEAGRPSNAMVHGARTQQKLAPLREQALEWSRERWPQLDDARRALVADLAARIRRIELWADESDILLRRKTGVDVHPAVVHADRWQARLDALIERLDGEQRERERAIVTGEAFGAELEESRQRWARVEARQDTERVS